MLPCFILHARGCRLLALCHLGSVWAGQWEVLKGSVGWEEGRQGVFLSCPEPSRCLFSPVGLDAYSHAVVDYLVSAREPKISAGDITSFLSPLSLKCLEPLAEDNFEAFSSLPVRFLLSSNFLSSIFLVMGSLCFKYLEVLLLPYPECQ